MKLLTALLVLIALVLAPFQVVLDTATAITDQGSPAISRLWVSTDEGDRFACTVSYIMPYINESASWVLTAGHCSRASVLKRTPDDGIAGLVNWRIIATNWNLGTVNDFAIGTAPDVRRTEHRRLWLADKAPERGEIYVHGFPEGVERVSRGELVPPEYADKYSTLVPIDPWGSVARKLVPELMPGTRLVLIPKGVIQSGSSGSPLLNADGRVVGVLWGVLYRRGLEGPGVEDNDVAMFTPIERVTEQMRFLGVLK